MNSNFRFRASVDTPQRSRGESKRRLAELVPSRVRARTRCRRGSVIAGRRDQRLDELDVGQQLPATLAVHRQQHRPLQLREELPHVGGKRHMSYRTSV